MEPQRTQDATKHVTGIVNAKYQKADLQSNVRDNILKHESKPLYNPQSFAQTLLEYKQTRKINLTHELTNLLQTLQKYTQSCKQTSCNVHKP
jgi:hypothetical protein